MCKYDNVAYTYSFDILSMMLKIIAAIWFESLIWFGIVHILILISNRKVQEYSDVSSFTS